MNPGPFSRLLPAAVLLLAFGSARAQTTHIVNQVNFTFSPADITIDVGDSVRWTWTANDHTVTEGLGPFPIGGEAFNAPLSSGAPNVLVTFDGKFLFEHPRTDNVYPYYCIPHFAFGMVGSVTVISPWVNDGFALAGTLGEPLLYGTGTLAGGRTASLELENAQPNALAGLFISFASAPAPFKGGMLCTVPLALSSVFPLGPTGAVSLPSLIPAGIPSGAQVFFQYAIQDVGAPKGVALSNCLRSSFP